jgi:succinyl-diaminopimelate desuccinylase
MGAEVIELGVCNRTIHKVNESVGVAEIDVLHHMYLQALQNLLG